LYNYLQKTETDKTLGRTALKPVFREENMDRLNLLEDSIQWWAFVSRIIDIPFARIHTICLGSWPTTAFSKRAFPYGLRYKFI